jgi:Zn-dependent peptidase ImmA (M78 family)
MPIVTRAKRTLALAPRTATSTLAASRQVVQICGLEYQLVVATAAEVPELLENEGWTSCVTNTIYVRANMPPTRLRDTVVHELLHAFLEASGVGSFLSDRVQGDYDAFEEVLVRLLTPMILRLVDDNGAALVMP